ncbi:hypothetical protein ACVNF4_30340 [Streptomyces sp. S6]
MPFPETVCRVCGQDDGSLLWNADGFPEWVYCDCCGIMSGAGDDHLDKIRMTRGYWVASGAVWDVPSNEPENWDLRAQLSRIPPEWR